MGQELQLKIPWQEELKRRLPIFGHRNWIVIADAAYPAHARAGIETIASEADHLEVLERVLASIASGKHVRPVLYSDLELDFVAEEDAPGISDYRRRLAAILDGAPHSRLPHAEIITMLDEAAAMFQVLIIKTSLLLPYTSIFLHLDCGYWSADAEQRLRKTMRAENESSGATLLAAQNRL